MPYRDGIYQHRSASPPRIPNLRAKFEGQPEHVINFFFLLAEEMRRTLQSLGMTSMDELVGAAGDVLEVDPAKLRSNGRPDKAMGLDLAPLLQSARELNPTAGYRHTQLQDHELGIKADNELMDAAHGLIETYAKGGEAEPIVIERETNNLDRTLGTMLSAKVSKACGKPGLPDDAVRIKLEGSSGQSLGFALAPGITIEVVGDANDGCGKGLSGGRVIVRPNPTQLEGGHFRPNENVIVGNVACYGATGGEAFFRGVGGERFCVRNSGALAVVEGVGDHGCEYMTGGRMVCLGKLVGTLRPACPAASPTSWIPIQCLRTSATWAWSSSGLSRARISTSCGATSRSTSRRPESTVGSCA